MLQVDMMRMQLIKDRAIKHIGTQYSFLSYYVKDIITLLWCMWILRYWFWGLGNSRSMTTEIGEISLSPQISLFIEIPRDLWRPEFNIVRNYVLCSLGESETLITLWTVSIWLPCAEVMEISFRMGCIGHRCHRIQGSSIKMYLR